MVNSNGWIDLQVNGRYGISFGSPNLTVEQVVTLTHKIVAEGTVGFLPTITTIAFPDTALKNVRLIAEAKRKDPVCAEAILGLHFEGPFISKEPGYVGAHNPAKVLPCDVAMMDEFQKESGGMLKLVTIAAEAEGAEAFTEAMTARGVTISIGHSAEWRPEVIDRLAKKGAKAFTHLGNGIPGILPRHQNIVWTGLARDDMIVMFIPDGFHLPDQVLKVYLKAVPVERLIAVSDCSYPGGLPPGEYGPASDRSILEPSGFLRCANTGLLHGSSCCLADAVKVLKRVGASDAVCKALAHDNPLKLIGLA